MSEAQPLNRTPLYDAHLAAGGRMVPFAGYEMPVQYSGPDGGVLNEHRWTRNHAGVFDVSHMGPGRLVLNKPSGDADADHRAVAAILERLVCGDIAGLKPGQQRYTLLLNEAGGVIDDLIVGRFPAGAPGGMLYIVVNASTKDGDYALIQQAAGDEATVHRMDGAALLAVQGPEAAEVVTAMIPEAAELGFMTFAGGQWRGHMIMFSRSGYTGEDGFEILVPPEAAREFWDALLADDRVRPIGLGARDSLRLEAGLPLYGHDLDETTSPTEGALRFAVSKRRREARDFPGAERILREWEGDLQRVRVGFRVLQGAPAREGAEIADSSGQVVGRVTSGGPSPTLGSSIGMAYVPPALAEPGTAVQVLVRGRAQPAEITATPFVPQKYYRKPAAPSGA
jgi:aminomethyltransferase